MENGSLLNHRYLLIHFLEGPGIIYDVIAYDNIFWLPW